MTLKEVRKFLNLMQMERNSIIILNDEESYEAWGSLSELCEKHSFSYNYLKRLKFPFTYRGIDFVKVPFRQKNGIPSNDT